MGSRPALVGLVILTGLVTFVGTSAAGSERLATATLPLIGAFPVDAFLAHWWVFPAAIVFSLIALAAGISSALFFSPFFLLAVGLAPAQAIGAGLLTMVFGMGNGLRSYVRQGVVDYATARWLLLGAIPATVAGALIANWAPDLLLRGIFGIGLVVLAGFLLWFDPPERQKPGAREGGMMKQRSEAEPTVITATDGTRFEYPTCWRPPGVALSTGGGVLTGLISAGLPEICTTQLITRCRIPPRVAIATSVFVMAVAAAAGALVHALSATPVWYIVAWSIPGVLVGSTVGTHVGKYLPSELLQTGLGVVFALIGVLVVVTSGAV